MARTTKKQEQPKETAVVATRAEKKDATKNLIKECLAVKPLKHNELIDEVAKLYKERFGGEDTENINDVKGRVGSVLDIMKKDSDVAYEGGMYALKARALPEEPVKKTVKKTVKKEETAEKKPAKKTTKKTVEKAETVQEKTAEETPVKKTAKKTAGKKAKEIVTVKLTPPQADDKEQATKKTAPLPPAPIQPIVPVAPVTPEVAPEPIPEEKPAPKKRGRKAKAVAEVAETPKTELETMPAVIEETKETPVEKTEEKAVETPVVTPVVAEEKPTETGLVVKEKAPVAKKEVIDVSFFLGGAKPANPTVKEGKPPVVAEKKPEIKQEEKPVVKAEKKPEVKPEQKPEQKPVGKPQQAHNVRKLSDAKLRNVRQPVQKPQTADERLREAYLKRIRSLGGDYFEYYSVYLLERYSMKNGRRLEGLRINGGDRDGGIDGEIELTDKLGFKETIYIQSKNWNPEKGDEKLWVVGETLLQQFIGACACRQAKEGKQHCRGIFITTSRFTPEAKRILDTMSDKIVGYDGNDLYEAAKECSFGLVEKNGVWSLDEKLLSGTKAFFNLY